MNNEQDVFTTQPIGFIPPMFPPYPGDHIYYRLDRLERMIEDLQRQINDIKLLLGQPRL